MLNAGQKQTLLLSLAPYLCLALYDSFLHERSRRVPPAEQAFHAAALVGLFTMIAGLFFDYPSLVVPGVSGFGVAAIMDEVGFHSALERRERLLHFAAYLCFAGFLLVASKIGALS